jgi:histidinol-phosphate aminotransferase
MRQPKSNIERLSPAVHGGPDYEEIDVLGLDPKEILDFSVSVNPAGPPPGLAEAVSRCDIAHYPDSESGRLKKALSRKLEIAPENLIVGSGSTELIRLAALAYFGEGDRVMVMKPTYGEYEIAAQIAGAEVDKLKLREEDDFRLSLFDLAEALQMYPPAGLFLCNPNNPTGQYLSRKEIERVLQMLPNSLLVVDEAYVSFVEDPWNSADLISHPNLLVIRSMTKDYGLAGLRLGYALANEEIIGALNKIKPPWNVSAAAQAAGIYALKAEGYPEVCRKGLLRSREYLTENLHQMGFKVLPSEANFCLVKAGDASGLRQALLERGILVRDCTSFGLPAYIRLCLRPLNECRKLVKALREFSNG